MILAYRTVKCQTSFISFTESERQLSILCALCQDTVDHPDLTHPNMCMKHKFCDDCILRAFTISSNCPACVDTAGLITIDKEDVNKNSCKSRFINNSIQQSILMHPNMVNCFVL